ncbi:MAG: PASTA domain-containing protein [Planctomycetaceae bacterium]|nr:PASTA domain-containing protein [Planctomycetaceae bacterium]
MRGLVWTAALALGLCWLANAIAQDRPSADKQLRPAPDVLRVNNVPPDLMKILKDWELSSAKIKKLEGKHRRWEYDYVFKVLKRNTGVFYYESPDKGRIDLEPVPNPEPPKNVKNPPPPVEKDKKHWLTGKEMDFELSPGPAERWYCNGQLITQVDDQSKTATQMVIPPQAQGEHISDGPLPFLFGMPAAKAIQRYDMKLINEDKKTSKAWIEARPRWQSDRANYKLATIILDLKTFLPDAVRLIDPAGTKETAFKFGELEVNSKSLTKLFRGDPFKFSDRNYKIVTKAPVDERAEQDDHPGSNGKVTPASATRPATKPAEKGSAKTLPSAANSKTKVAAAAPLRVPSLVGMEWKQARKILETLGYKVSFVKGSTANRDEEVNHVERQQPDPKANLAEGETVTLWLFIAPKEPE